MATSTDAVVNSRERCGYCHSPDSWVIHKAHLRGSLHSLCTHCLLLHHPASFCPLCFAFYDEDSSPPHPSHSLSCSNCRSLTHTQCAPDVNPSSSSYLCPPCRNSPSFSFFRPIIGPNGRRFVDNSLSAAFYCAAKIAASSLNKAVSALKCDSEERGIEASLARKKAREALEHVGELDMKKKARLVIPKLEETSIDTVQETTPTTKNNVGTEKQNPVKQLDEDEQESDGSK